MRIVTASCLLIAACATGLPPRPVSAKLLATRLSVTFTDGVTCHAEAEFAGRLQEGEFAACPHPTRYSVDAREPANRVSDTIASIFAALDLGDTLSPLAVVTITAADGRTAVFASPASN